jgi:hypothetical protein
MYGDELQKAQEELSKQAEQYAEEKKNKEKEDVKKKVDMVEEFIKRRGYNADYSKIKKLICKVFSNAVEDYIEIEIHDDKKMLSKGSNFEGITYLDDFSEKGANDLVEFLCGNYIRLFDLPHQTVFQINIE